MQKIQNALKLIITDPKLFAKKAVLKCLNKEIVLSPKSAGGGISIH